MIDSKSNSHPEMGYISAIKGSLIKVKGFENFVRLHDLVKIVKYNIVGEIIQIYSDHVVVQCYENTNNLKLRESVVYLKEPLSMELAPGLLSNVFDGIQRPLEIVFKEIKGKGFLERGFEIKPLSRTKKWKFIPKKKVNDIIKAGDILGITPETSLIEHKIIAPPQANGKITYIAEAGEYTITDEIYRLKRDGNEVSYPMLQKWPITQNRPYKKKDIPTEPLITGIRVIDLLFPIGKGGTVAVPGGFGTGKCVLADTPIILSNGEIREIKDIYDFYKSKEKKSNLVKEEESLIEIKEKLEVISFNKVKLKNGNATHIYRGKTNKYIKIKTRSGRTVELTPIHKLHIFDGQNIVEKSALDLKIGEYIAVPRKINIEGKEIFFDINHMDDSLRIADEEALIKIKILIRTLKKSHKLKDLAESINIPYNVFLSYWQGTNKPTLKFLKKLVQFSKTSMIDVKLLKAERQSQPFRFPKKLNKEIAEWLGLFVADGHIKGKYGGVYLYNTSYQILNRFKDLTQIAFDLTTEYGQDSDERTPYMCIRNTAFIKFLHMLGIPEENKTYEIKVPQCILKSPEILLIQFLNGYFAGDGWFSKYTVGFSTASKNLHIGLSYLFSRLGILYRVSKKKNSYYIELEGKRSIQLASLLKSSDIFVYDKLLPLFDYLKKNGKHFNGLDIVPIDIKLITKIKNQGRDAQGHNIFRKYEGIRLDNYIKRNQIPSISMLERLYAVINKYKPNIEQKTINTIKKILDISKNIYFDRIKEIKVIDKETEVYDLTVEDYHNFIGGKQPVLLHNTVIQQSLAKWCNADVIVFIGCGERGNEIADVLKQFAEIIDPKSGRSLIERIVLIANTSNMPVSAREASIFSGVTIAEYYRDMGYDVAVLADSTSRWAESLREISGLLEEMPAEEGYPAYLPSKLSSFYERAGNITALGRDERGEDLKGSLTIIGSVSPPAGDFSEPVTATTKRFVQAFWALDASLAYSKHYPAINWLNSYSNYPDYISDWWYERDIDWPEIDIDWFECRKDFNQILSKENELSNITQLIGEENLPEEQQLIMFIARLIRNGFLIQNAFDDIDNYTDSKKVMGQAKIIILLYQKALELLNEGVIIEDIMDLEIINEILRIGSTIKNDEFEKITQLKNKLLERLELMKSLIGSRRKK